MSQLIRVWQSQEEQAAKLLKDIPKGVQTATVRALNRGLESVVSEAVKVVTDDYYVKAGAVRKTIRTTKAKIGDIAPSVEVKSVGRSLPLFDFRTNIRTPMTQGIRGKRLKVWVKKGGKATTLPNAFVQRIKSGRLVIAERQISGGERVGRTPWRFLYSLAIPVMMGAKNPRARIEHKAKEAVHKRFMHEVNYILTRGKI